MLSPPGLAALVSANFLSDTSCRSLPVGHFLSVTSCPPQLGWKVLARSSSSDISFWSSSGELRVRASGRWADAGFRSAATRMEVNGDY
ncbi:hypothetical protein EYF80_058586 [Liparis tanakae]|uniref:Uncharacterized protein n=1 Tax=Liparis tanakae TaxID=230148 RepID=A0A4Z2ERP8_9TELE|nr:hypothetical protein EYF80_058586 [Liparis tanakae]